MKQLLILLSTFFLLQSCCDKGLYTVKTPNGEDLTLTAMADNAIRVQYSKEITRQMPEWIYEGKRDKLSFNIEESENEVKLSLKEIVVYYDKSTSLLSFFDKSGNLLCRENAYSLVESSVQGEKTYIAELQLDSPEDECLYGLGQFQDGYLNVRGLSRRLTQVNSQISIPMVLSSRGYALLWNNYGMMDFNPASSSVSLNLKDVSKDIKAVNVTSTEGGRREMRRGSVYNAELELEQSGTYALLLDVGQAMARSHNLSIDGETVIDMKNTWLPPTASTIIELTSGVHTLEAKLENNDKPVLYYKLIDNQTTYRSSVAQAVDFTVFAGDADSAISSYRKLSGDTPMLPDWAFGYVHCRERYHSSDEIIENAKRFGDENLPLDVIIQDWQYWGKYGWNAMQFDEEFYPDPKALTDSLHKMGKRFMLSVWSKIDENCEVGSKLKAAGYYIDNTTWIDFFNPSAATAYWDNFSERLVPLGIDAWWQDATEPENDDLVGRKIWNNTVPGEVFRNTYPLLVSKTVYEGLRKSAPGFRNLILTRCAFPGSQRYASLMWSGDVGNDWETLRRQLTAGLSFNAAGMPWWTYDAGGFFRPWTQYGDEAYKERMLRWLQISTFLPMMRTHGYMSNTEFWHYGQDVVDIARTALNLRYELFPYIYSSAAEVSLKGSTMMRPLVMDFRSDTEALKQNYEYMFGSGLLVAPVLKANVQSLKVYLPNTQGGWYDFASGAHYDCGYCDVAVGLESIPVFARAGSIVPLSVASGFKSVADVRSEDLVIRVYAGSDAHFELYEDEGTNYNYEKGMFALTSFTWDDTDRTLTVSKSGTKFAGISDRSFRVELIDKNGKIVSEEFSLRENQKISF